VQGGPDKGFSFFAEDHRKFVFAHSGSRPRRFVTAFDRWGAFEVSFSLRASHAADFAVAVARNEDGHGPAGRECLRSRDEQEGRRGGGKKEEAKATTPARTKSP
jgi:hypothetical protein